MSATDYAAAAEALDVHLYGKPDIYTPPEAFMPRRGAIAEKLAELFPERPEREGGDTIDHKREAMLAIRMAGRDVSANFEVLTGEKKADILALGLLHATLALVEQQRIANLLVLLKPEDPRGYDVWPEIQEALGLS